MSMFLFAMRDLGLGKHFKDFEVYAPPKSKGTPTKADVTSALDYVLYVGDDGLNLNTFCEVFGLDYSATSKQILDLVRETGPKYVIKYIGSTLNELKK